MWSSMNHISYTLRPKVGVEKRPPASECTSSKGFVVGLNGTLMNLCSCLAWMQTAHIESLCVHPPIRYFRVVGVIWASHRCHSLCSESVRDFWVNLVFAAVGALGGELSLFLFLRFTVVDDWCAVAGTTGKNVLTRRVTHREAVYGPVIHSIFSAWHYEVLWTCKLTRLL